MDQVGSARSASCFQLLSMDVFYFQMKVKNKRLMDLLDMDMNMNHYNYYVYDSIWHELYEG